jgi:hypothetical protein
VVVSLAFLVSMQAIAQASAGVAAPAISTIVEPDPAHMTMPQIRAFNAQLRKSHPFTIRCRVEAETGSLVRATRTCRTLQQWTQLDRQGNDEARDLVASSQKRGQNTQ